MGWDMQPLLSPHRRDFSSEWVSAVLNRHMTYSTEPHTHDCDMIFIPLAGRFAIDHEYGRQIKVVPGQFIWLPKDYAHATRAYSREQKHLALYVDGEFWNFAAQSNGVKRVAIGSRAASQAFASFATRLASLPDGVPDHAASAICGALVHEATRLSNVPPLAAESRSAADYAMMLAEQIRSNPVHKLDVALYAKRQRMSRRHVERLFLQMTGMSPLQFQQEQRLTRAIQLLQTTDYSVLAIACEVGWNSGSYLSRMLMKRHGITPASLRQTSRLKVLLPCSYDQS